MEKFADLKNRLLISCVVIAFVTIFILFSGHPVMTVIVMFIAAITGVGAIWEYVEFLKTKSIHLPFILLAIFTALLIFTNYLQILNYSITGITQIMLGLFILAIFLYYFSKVDEAIVHISTCLFGIVYILVPLSLMIRILYPETIVHVPMNGKLWLTYLISVTKITDIGGYFLGTRWGKSKLAPNISPGKTLVGSIGGFIFALCLSLLFYLFSHFFPEFHFSLTFVQALILGGLIGIFGQIGDLAESLLKRDAKVKDSNSIPGVGGVLDNLDSLLFTAPIVYIFIKNM
ncbi:MAG: hypothetical protein SP4CHLAM5_05440 [Chlamydiia bacterium]|nr:hypothetical protein [Chlamydiia bacterium]MCH9618414.1 hypothetical protein [Chlamydiia bacterium]MCH9623740.1 hypothetical protein [Chlamydiia bacterium]